MSPTAGRDYPRSYAQLRGWFDEDGKCLDYLDWLRWPDGFVCPRCGSDHGWRAPDLRWRCAGCDRRVSVTAGTIFDKTRTPLTVWFAAAWLLVNSKTGVSATQLRREMGLGSVQTAWAMLHRYRTVMVRPGRDRLRGDVEVDESFLGGPEPGVPGRGALGKVLFAAAVEVNEGRIGRARLGVIPDASAVSLAAFLDANVEPGSRVITDGWSAYPCGHPGPLPTPGHLDCRLRPARARGPAGCAPGLLPGQALGDGHHAGLGQPRACAGLLRRVSVPVQPAALAQPRATVPHAAATGSRRPAGDLPLVAQGRTDPASATARARCAG